MLLRSFQSYRADRESCGRLTTDGISDWIDVKDVSYDTLVYVFREAHAFIFVREAVFSQLFSENINRDRDIIQAYSKNAAYRNTIGQGNNSEHIFTDTVSDVSTFVVQASFVLSKQKTGL